MADKSSDDELGAWDGGAGSSGAGASGAGSSGATGGGYAATGGGHGATGGGYAGGASYGGYSSYGGGSTEVGPDAPGQPETIEHEPTTLLGGGHRPAWWPSPTTATAGPVDVTPEADPPPPRRARHPATLVGGVVVIVLALVLAGAGVKRLVGVASGTSAAPAQYVPATALAYAQVDLDPPAAEKLSLFSFTRKFPGSPTNRPGASVSDLRDTLLSGMLSDTPISYDNDLKPWLGRWLGAAAIPSASGMPQVVVVAAVDDKDAARTTLGRLTASRHAAYAFHGDYALIAESGAALAAAQAALAKGSLGDQSEFRSDVAALPADEIVLGWADVGRFVSELRQMRAHARCSDLGGTGSCGPLDGLCFDPTNPLCQLPATGLLGGSGQQVGRVMLGAKVTDDYVDVQFRSRGGQATAPRTDISAAVADLPSDTVGAVGIGSPATVLRQQWAIDSMLLPLSGLAFVPEGDVSSGSSTYSISNASWTTPGTPPRKSGSAPVGSDPQRRLSAMIERATGLAFPADFATMLGDRAVLAVARRGDQADVAVRSHPTDLTKAEALANRLADRALRRSDPHVAVTTAGGDLVVASSTAYAQRVVAGGDLGSSGRFRSAMGDTSGAWFEAYVDFGALHTGEPVRTALGVVARHAGSDTVLQLRLVAG